MNINRRKFFRVTALFGAAAAIPTVPAFLKPDKPDHKGIIEECIAEYDEAEKTYTDKLVSLMKTVMRRNGDGCTIPNRYIVGDPVVIPTYDMSSSLDWELGLSSDWDLPAFDSYWSRYQLAMALTTPLEKGVLTGDIIDSVYDVQKLESRSTVEFPLYISDIKYEFPTDDNFTESITLTGQGKVWRDDV